MQWINQHMKNGIQCITQERDKFALSAMSQRSDAKMTPYTPKEGMALYALDAGARRLNTTMINPASCKQERN